MTIRSTALIVLLSAFLNSDAVAQPHPITNPPPLPPLPVLPPGYSNLNCGASMQSFSSFQGADSPSGPPGPPGGGGATLFGPPYVLNTNGLWLEMTGLDTNGFVYGNLHNATNQVYAIWSTTNLPGGWNVELELWPSNSAVMPFTGQTLGRSNLFLLAEDWTGVTANGNTVPLWWFFKNYGDITLSDTNLDSTGEVLINDYLNGTDPNVIAFSISATNNYIATSSTTVQLAVSQGTPFYSAVLVDSTNFSGATWNAYSSSNAPVVLGLTEGWHDVYIGLRGKPSDATVTWQWKRMKLDFTPPTLALTGPTNTTLNVPVMQLQGFSPEALSSMTCTLSNASGVFTNLNIGVTDQIFSTNTIEFTTNTFEALDIPLTNGVNTVFIQATDLAGNTSTTNFAFVFDSSTRTNPPAVALYWPQDGTSLANTNYTWRGWVDDSLATVTAQTVDANGVTNTYTGIVERDGNFWIENLTLTGATNWLSLSVTDSAGNIATTNITIVASPVSLTIQPPTEDLWNKFINVYGTISDTADYTVWVNGVQAVITNGTWAATNVYLPDGGTALLQARAIPISDNGGNGTGGTNSPTMANPGNPSSSGALDSELQIDKPAEIIVTSEYFHDYQMQYGPNSTNTTDSQVNWYRDEPFNLVMNTTQVSASLSESISSVESCPADPEWQYNGGNPLGTVSEQVSSNGLSFNYSGPGRNPWTWGNEFCQTDVTFSGYYEKRTEIPKCTLHTGGKGVSGLLSIFQLSCSAVKIMDLFNGEPQIPIPFQMIKVMGQILDTNGTTYLALADNTTRDDTPQINEPFYDFSPGQQKFTETITLNGKDVTGKQMGDEINKIIAGRLYTLDCVISPGLPTNMTPTYQWQTTSDMLTDWHHDDTNSQKIYVTNVTNSSLSFGWYKDGSKTVSCTVSFPDGTVLRASTSADVEKPTSSIEVVYQPTVTVDTSWLWNPDGPSIHYGSNTNDLAMRYTPPNISVGTYSWLQIGNISRTQTFTNPVAIWSYKGSGLDGSFPWTVVDSNYHFHDAPGDGLSIASGEQTDTIRDSFTIYLMYQPSGGFYVPICQIDWSWGGTAVLDTNSPCGWSLAGTPSAPTPSGEGPTSEYPTWTNTTSYILNNPLIH